MENFKICFMGDQSVGKTSIINRFIYDDFNINSQSTVGVDFLSKTIFVENESVRLHLWDTAGQERFRCLIPSYVRNSSLVVIVFDITNKTSFKSIEFWMDTVQNERGDDVIVFLVGNKTDIEDERQVSLEKLEKEANKHGFLYLETSAKTGHNVKQLFRKIGIAILKQNKKRKELIKPELDENTSLMNISLNIDPNKLKQKEDSGCC
ncbi:rab gtpase [Anaeramoeba flamelloides]|uniref:Rab gtpase n=1 Tax=Anaeramoeba flamelloides TaxID=1746091 RepID=A0AAV8AB30_9EUKA|nr:rab gtpase [Anaeramoeba flamelloides]KAJ6231664.1 rab gtpase [Anaeramoeba flamelloides]